MQQQDHNKDWLRVDPLQIPILNAPPQHDPDRFKEYIELKDDKDEVIGFTVNDVVFLFDATGGWRDERGCYYDEDGKPAGWFVLHPGDGAPHEHFYDADGMYVPTDVEEDESSGGEDSLNEDAPEVALPHVKDEYE